MKRFHVHTRVKNLSESIEFYNALFNAQPTIVKPDYAKWMLEDPRINYAISTGHSENGIEHLGLQVETESELREVYANMEKAKGTVREEGECTCCYSKSQKSWITDPQGVDWEAFYTHGTATVYGEGINAKQSPEAMEQWTSNDGKVAEIEIPVQKESTCDGSCALKPTQNIISLLILIIVFFANLSVAFGQNSQNTSIVYKSISPNFDHYQQFAQLSGAAQNPEIDAIKFPLSDFRRMSYLKLKTVYLDIPVSEFKISNFPANSSDQTKAEIAFLLELQSQRTPEILAQTDAMAEVYYDPFTNNPTDPDYSRNINSLFFIGRNLGDWYNPENLPVTSSVLQNIIQDATYYFFSLKSDYARPRPYHLSNLLQNPEAPGHSSFPSGHSSASYVNALVLSLIFPEYENQFMGNAYDMAFSREIRGVHYPSDSKMGEDFARNFVAILMKNKKFLVDFNKMKTELQQYHKN